MHYLCSMMYYDIDNEIVAFSTERGCKDADLAYDGFNITYYTDDEPQHVATCRQQLCTELGIGDERLILLRQVHDTRIAEVTAQTTREQLEGIDAVMTTLSRTCIGVSTADCVPILIYDTCKHAIAAAHAGWRGSVGRIGSKTIETMGRHYGSRAEDLKVVIGPSIGPEAFEVGDEVYEAFCGAGFDMAQIAWQRGGKWHIDLWQANVQDIQQTGVAATNIKVAGICTYQHYDRFFSARRLGIKSGRIYTGIMIK